MVEMAWKSFKEVEAEKSYFAYVALAMRKSVWSYFGLLMSSRKVANQLSETEGLVGFAARGEFLNKKVIQLAVFDDEAALKAFAHSGQHAECIRTTKSLMESIKSVTWNVLGSEIPLKIDKEVKRVQA
jgi:hypothetical protein